MRAKDLKVARRTLRVLLVLGLACSGAIAGCAGGQTKDDTSAEEAARGVSSDVDAVKQFNKAIEVYEQSKGSELGQVESHLRKALRQDSKFGKAHYNLGVVLEK